MTDIVPLAEAIDALLIDGASVALEGFTHLIPYAAGHEIIRQGRTDLTLIRMTPDILYDQMIGMGCASKLVFSWGGNPGVGSLHRFRDAVENSWPRALELEEHSHAGMANRYVAGASGLPFAILRGYVGTDLVGATDTIRTIASPFTGELVASVQSINPDVSVIHAQRADVKGNVQMWGITGIQKEAVLAATRCLVTVEELVEKFEPCPGQVILPHWVVDYVSVCPGGSWPSYSDGYSVRDNGFYSEWDSISRDRDVFLSWMSANVLSGAVTR